MTPDVAAQPSTLAAAPSKASREYARAETKLIAAFSTGLVLLGFVLQRFVDPGPVPVVIYTTLMTITLLATAFVVRGRMLDMMAGFRLAAVTLSILGIAAALGTMILQNKPVEYYRGALGSLGVLILALRLDDLFHAFWFGGLVALLNCGLITSALRRLPITARNAGFFMVHLGIIVTLVGAGVSAVFSVKGRIDLRIGQTATTVKVSRSGLPTSSDLPLNASISLLDFDVDHYADQPRLSLYVPNKKGAGYELKASFENEIGLKHRLPMGNAFRLKAYYPDLVMTEKLLEQGGDKPALKLTVDGKPAYLMAGERTRLDSKDGAVAVLFGWQRPDAKIGAPLHKVKVGEAEAAVRLGETVTVGTTKLTALRFFPHFTYDLGTKSAVNVSPNPVNPALEVEVDGAKKWLFANMPGFGHGEGQTPLSYLFAPEGGVAAATVLAVGGADRTVLVKKPDGTEETVPLKEGLELHGVTFGALLEKAALQREPSTASQEAKRPAVMVELTNQGITRDVLLIAGQRDPIEVGNAFLTFETRVPDVKAFRSQVKLSDSKGERNTIIAVNDPGYLGDWTLYQVNYDPKDPTYSGLEAVRDPGVFWVFVGFGLLFFGVFYMLYVGPRLRRVGAPAAAAATPSEA